MADENSDPEFDLNLDLSLGLPQRRNPVNRQGRLVPQEEDPVEKQGHGQGTFMQLLTSFDPPRIIQPSPTQPPHMTSLIEYLITNGTNPRIFPEQALPLYSSPSVQTLHLSQLNQVETVAMQTPRLEVPLHYQPSGQLLHPPQTVALETPRRGRKPGAQARRKLAKAGAVKKKDDKVIIPPYPWSTNKLAIHHTISELTANNINRISGEVHCKPCDMTHTISYNLMEKFSELYVYIRDNKEVMRTRAPAKWLAPELIPCEACKTDMRPVIKESTEKINWLFLLLGQMLGCCTLEQLKFFCEAIVEHRTGCKDRVLYTTYLILCGQLDPQGPFSIK
ncbi:PREDICTED: uncharacterized protein LOC104768091 [Camelina sativa]|uniref:Uncharacterized protein LOC104768091 n=1 Tax=Camelina sativa TaxID=90675 RepID=A0ABM0XSE3_CAMSA|nr:PREDICTED: uncharacterized protein LOC104768091 [Camelina sativa]